MVTQIGTTPIGSLFEAHSRQQTAFAGAYLENRLGELQKYCAEWLSTASPSPGDGRMWGLNSDLPILCRYLFGSASGGPNGVLDRQLGRTEEQSLVELLRPESAFFQLLMKSAAENMFYEVSPDVLPNPVKSRLQSTPEQLPAVHRERLWQDSTGQRQLKFTLVEYYLFYFLYFMYMHDESSNASSAVAASGTAATMRKSSSILSVTAANPPVASVNLLNHDKSGLKGSRPRRPVASNTLYTTLLNMYLEYFLPESHEQLHHQQPQMNDGGKHLLSAGRLSRTSSLLTENKNFAIVYGGVFECRLIDEQQRQRVSHFFCSMLIQLWLGQNEYQLLPSSSHRQEISIIGGQYIPPKQDHFELTRLVVRHFFSRSRAAKFAIFQYPVSPGHSGIFDYSQQQQQQQQQFIYQYQNKDAYYNSIYSDLRVYLYRFLRMHLSQFQPDENNPLFDSTVDLWIDWVTPWKTGDRPDDWSQDPSQWQIFVADNFPFYSTLFDAILQKFHGRLSFNDLLISLSRRELEASAPRPSSIAIEDLRLVSFLALSEVTLHSPTDQFLGALLEGEGLASYLQRSVQTPRQVFAGDAPFEQSSGSSSQPKQKQNWCTVDQVLRYQALLKQSFLQLEPIGGTAADRQPFMFGGSSVSGGDVVARTYAPVFIDRECETGRRLLRKLNQLSVAQQAWLERMATTASKPQTLAVQRQSSSLIGRLVDVLFTSGSSDSASLQRLEQEVCQQHELCESLIVLLETQLFKQITDEEKVYYRQLAQQQVAESFNAFQQQQGDGGAGGLATGAKGGNHKLNQRPETEPGNPMRLTRRGREQIRLGMRKCSNLDLRQSINDPANVRQIKSYEIAVLVKPLVYFGLWLDESVSARVLAPIERRTNGWVRFPDALHRFRWERLLRLFAAKPNLLFFTVCISIWLMLRTFIRFIVWQ